jgi:hypothetical protein
MLLLGACLPSSHAAATLMPGLPACLLLTALSPPLQAAIAAANSNTGGGVVYLPPGVYLLYEPLVVTRTNVIIRGAGVSRACGWLALLDTGFMTPHLLPSECLTWHAPAIAACVLSGSHVCRKARQSSASQCLCLMCMTAPGPSTLKASGTL